MSKSVRRMANVIMGSLRRGLTAAECLMRTETSYVQNQTAAQSYRDAGCTEYEVLTAKDRRTCQYCAKQTVSATCRATMQAGDETRRPSPQTARCTVLPVVKSGWRKDRAGTGFAVAKTETAPKKE